MAKKKKVKVKGCVIYCPPSVLGKKARKKGRKKKHAHKKAHKRKGKVKKCLKWGKKKCVKRAKR